MQKVIWVVLAMMTLILGTAVAQETEVTPEVTAEATEEIPAFPVTFEHKFGSITLEEAPERIVVLGYTEQDPYFALGVVPVAIRYWFGDEENAVFPWAEEAADGEIPLVLNMPYDALNYELILELEPDLISAIDGGITEEQYEALSQIAPVLAQTDEYIDYGTPWQETTLTIGRAIGKSAEAAALVAEVEEQFETTIEEHPEFEDKSIVVAYNFGGTYGFYTDQDSRGRFFTELGFVVPEELVEVAGDSFYANLSEERFDLFDQDVIVFLSLAYAEDGADGILANPILSQLDVFQEERIVFVPAELDDALNFSTVLSLPYLLDNLVPLLAEVVEE